jgi:hypothetical protein
MINLYHEQTNNNNSIIEQDLQHNLYHDTLKPFPQENGFRVKLAETISTGKWFWHIFYTKHTIISIFNHSETINIISFSTIQN